MFFSGDSLEQVVTSLYCSLLSVTNLPSIKKTIENEYLKTKYCFKQPIYKISICTLTVSF